MMEEHKRRYDTAEQIDFEFAKEEADFCGACPFEECVNCLHRGWDYAVRTRKNRLEKKSTLKERVLANRGRLLPREGDSESTAIIRAELLRGETDIETIAAAAGVSTSSVYRIIREKIL